MTNLTSSTSLAAVAVREEKRSVTGREKMQTEVRTKLTLIDFYINLQRSLILPFKMGTVTQTITARHPSSSESITYQSNHRLFVLCTHLENDLTCQLEKQIT